MVQCWCQGVPQCRCRAAPAGFTEGLDDAGTMNAICNKEFERKTTVILIEEMSLNMLNLYTENQPPTQGSHCICKI